MHGAPHFFNSAMAGISAAPCFFVPPLAGPLFAVFVGIHVRVKVVCFERMVCLFRQTANDPLSLGSVDFNIVSLCRSHHPFQAAPVSHFVHPIWLPFANHLGVVESDCIFDDVPNELRGARNRLVVGEEDRDPFLVKRPGCHQRRAGFHFHGSAQRTVLPFTRASCSHAISGTLHVDVGFALVHQLELQRHRALRGT